MRNLLHMPHFTFASGRSLDPHQRAGKAPVAGLGTAPAAVTGPGLGGAARPAGGGNLAQPVPVFPPSLLSKHHV